MAPVPKFLVKVQKRFLAPHRWPPEYGLGMVGDETMVDIGGTVGYLQSCFRIFNDTVTQKAGQGRGLTKLQAAG